MARIVITLSDEAKALAEKHAGELGYEHAGDWAFELLRNYAATREDALYHRMHTGEHNPVFGCSKREAKDRARRTPVSPTPPTVKKRAAKKVKA